MGIEYVQWIFSNKYFLLSVLSCLCRKHLKMIIYMTCKERPPALFLPIYGPSCFCPGQVVWRKLVKLYHHHPQLVLYHCYNWKDLLFRHYWTVTEIIINQTQTPWIFKTQAKILLLCSYISCYYLTHNTPHAISWTRKIWPKTNQNLYYTRVWGMEG